MKNLIFISSFMLIGFITSSCSDNENEKTQAPTKQIEKIVASRKVMTEIVKINVETIATEDKRIVVNGTTNLPNSTSLLVTLNNEGLGFSAQDKVNVPNGHFSSSPLGKTTGLPDGNYAIEILMPLPSTQPETVQAIFGQQGQHLTGPLVDDSEWGGRIVEKSISYSIGSSESISQVENKHQDLIARIRKETTKLLTLGQEMENIRNTKNLNKLRLCGDQMRKKKVKQNN